MGENLISKQNQPVSCYTVVEEDALSCRPSEFYHDLNLLIMVHLEDTSLHLYFSFQVLCYQKLRHGHQIHISCPSFLKREMGMMRFITPRNIFGKHLAPQLGVRWHYCEQLAFYNLVSGSDNCLVSQRSESGFSGLFLVFCFSLYFGPTFPCYETTDQILITLTVSFHNRNQGKYNPFYRAVLRIQQCNVE